MVKKVVKKVVKLARAAYPDGLPHAEDALATLVAASAQTRLLLDDEEKAWPGKERRCAFLEGFKDRWVIRQAEVIVAAKRQHGFAVDL